MKLPRLSLKAHLVCLLTAMAAAFVATGAYALFALHPLQQQYQQLLQQQQQHLRAAADIQYQIESSASLVYAAVHDSHVPSTPEDETHLYAIQRQLTAALDALGIGPQHATLHHHLDSYFVASMWTMQTTRRYGSAQGMEMLRTSFIPALSMVQKKWHEVERSMQQAQQAHIDASWAHIAAAQRDLAWRCMALLVLCTISAWCYAVWRIWRPWPQTSQAIEQLYAQAQASAPDTTLADTTDPLAARPSVPDMLHYLGQRLSAPPPTALPADPYFVEQLHKITKDLPGAVFQMRMQPGGEPKLHFVSPQWTVMMGLDSSEDCSAEHAARMLREHAPHTLDTALEHFTRSAQTMEPVNYEVSIPMLDGVTRWIKTRANPHLEPDGCVFFNGVWLDVSQEVMQSRALEKAKRHAEQIAQEKSTLQASISHEIRTPLNAILGLSQLLVKAPLAPAQREQAENILRASKHLRGIVNEVLDFSKIDAGQLQLESADFSLQDVIEDVLRMCREDAQQKGLELGFRIAPDVPDELRGDPHRIAQILLNYVNNAIKFTEKGTIHIIFSLDAQSSLHRVVLRGSVQDTGPGIPADRIAQLFHAFQQADNTITRRFGGTGLGLTISRELAKLMGGMAGVDSVVNEGSTFWFTATLEPARSNVVRKHLLPLETVAQQKWQGLHMLVVDDNPLNRAVAEGMLRTLGIEVDTADDGLTALERLQAQPIGHYACVLMDIQMPHMDGLSATQALRKMPQGHQLPVVAMTAHTGLQEIAQMQAAGMNGHLSKPLLELALLKCLQQYVTLPRANLSQPAPSPALDGPSSVGYSQPEQPAPFSTSEAAALPEQLAIDTLPEFDAIAIDNLVQLLDTQKLEQLLQQFVNDTAQRVALLQTLLQEEQWPTMRAEVHKLAGTAATFGLMRLGHLSQMLSNALRAADTAQVHTLTHAMAVCTDSSLRQLRAYLPQHFA